MSSPYGPATQLVNSVGKMPQKALDTIAVPVDALLKMLGMQAPNPEAQQADPGMVREANETFLPKPEQPVVAPPKRKPMGTMGR